MRVLIVSVEFKEKYDFLFYNGSRITFQLLIETILVEIIDYFDIIGFIQNDSSIFVCA